MILNYIIKHLFKGIDEKDLFKINSGKLHINGDVCTEDQAREYKTQAIRIINSRVWKMLKQKMSYRSQELMFRKAKTTDDLFFGKAMLYNLDLMDKYLEKISKIK